MQSAVGKKPLRLAKTEPFIQCDACGLVPMKKKSDKNGAVELLLLLLLLLLLFFLPMHSYWVYIITIIYIITMVYSCYNPVIVIIIQS